MTESSSEKGQLDIVNPAASNSFGRRRSDSTLGYFPVDEQSVISHKGETGLFTPLGKDDQINEISAKNLTEIIELLRQRIRELDTDNSRLKIQLKQATERPARTPDDFATAISHSVDSLQSKLGRMTNETSNFVLRDFKIDTKVFIDVTPLGTVDYRFVQPGDDIDANELTNISLTLSPIPKQTSVGSFSGPDFTPFEDIDEIQGIGDAYKQRLNERQIYTVSDLLHAGTRTRSKVELASMLELEHSKLSEWLSHAELLTIKEIDGRMAEVLFDIGVTRLTKLALQAPEILSETYNRQVKKMDHKILAPIDHNIAQGWIKAAQTYTGEQPESAKNKAAASPTPNDDQADADS
jgi:hypothetical protein